MDECDDSENKRACPTKYATRRENEGEEKPNESHLLFDVINNKVREHRSKRMDSLHNMKSRGTCLPQPPSKNRG